MCGQVHLRTTETFSPDECWIPFSCSGFTEQALCMLAHWLTGLNTGTLSPTHPGQCLPPGGPQRVSRQASSGTTPWCPPHWTFPENLQREVPRRPPNPNLLRAPSFHPIIFNVALLLKPHWHADIKLVRKYNWRYWVDRSPVIGVTHSPDSFQHWNYSSSSNTSSGLVTWSNNISPTWQQRTSTEVSKWASKDQCHKFSMWPQVKLWPFGYKRF